MACLHVAHLVGWKGGSAPATAAVLQRLKVEKITGHQAVRGRGGVIAVMYVRDALDGSFWTVLRAGNGKPCKKNLHDLPHAYWAGSVLHRCCTTSHNGKVGSR